MGHRANLVIVTETSYELYYDHWIANTLPFQVFWGPEHALKLIRLQAQHEPDQWTDPYSIEAGILIDPFKQVVLLFGCENEPLDLSKQAILVECMGYQWPSWKIQWAYRKMYDFALYLGIFDDFCQRFPLIYDRKERMAQVEPPQFQVLAADARVLTLLSIRFNDGQVYFFPLHEDVFNLLYTPLQAFDGLHPHLIYQTFDLSLMHKELVDCLHLDLQQQVVHVWSADINPNLQLLPHPWPGWRLHHYGYDFNQYQQLVDQQVTLPIVDYAAAWDAIKTNLFNSDQNQAFNFFTEIIAQSKAQSIQIYPDTLKHHEYHLSLEQREALLAATEAAFRQAHGL
ncbi:hypothetical protein [Herpetosiphon sp. NSE202]|uniref:hypothetical protein n=1 Tax=Herpetosiphon sp. NSE202 TaxID=3351349 RepID=UPI003641AB56